MLLCTQQLFLPGVPPSSLGGTPGRTAASEKDVNAEDLQHFQRPGSSCHAGGDAEEDDSEVERLLQQIADARHAGDRRDAMSQLSSLLQDNIRVSIAQTLCFVLPSARGVQESNSMI